MLEEDKQNSIMEMTILIRFIVYRIGETRPGQWGNCDNL
jgi:hypothetical protein